MEKIDLSVIQKGEDILSINLFNTGFVDTYTVEVFNALFNGAFARTPTSAPVQTNGGFNPYNTLLVPNPGHVQPLLPSVIFDTAGDMWVWNGDNNGCRIGTFGSSVSVPYLTVLKWLQSNKLHVTNLKITSTNSQPDSFRVIQRDIFGKQRDITLYPQNYISPMQVQPGIYSMDIDIIIDGFTCIEYVLHPQDIAVLEFRCKI